MINPFDTYAIEEALAPQRAVRRQGDGDLDGPAAGREGAQRGGGHGRRRGRPAQCARFAGSDTWATAYTLAQAIRKLGDYDLILCGKQAIDGDTGQVGPGIARQLGIPQLTYVFKIRSFDPRRRGPSRSSGCWKRAARWSRTPLPALLTVVKDINQPRYPTFLGIRRARKMEIPVWTRGRPAGT